MDRIVTYGRVRKVDGDRFLCDLRGPGGVTTGFPIFRGAFQVPPVGVDPNIAFMTWETRDDSGPSPLFGHIQLHQSACVISPERHEELSMMSYEEARKSLIRKEFFTISSVSGP